MKSHKTTITLGIKLIKIIYVCTNICIANCLEKMKKNSKEIKSQLLKI